MRNVFLFTCLVIAGCGAEAKVAVKETPKVEQAEKWSKIPEGTEGVVTAGMAAFAEITRPDKQEWAEDSAEFTYPWVDAGDKLIVLKEHFDKDGQRPVFVRMLSGRYKDRLYMLERQYISTPRR